MGAISTRDMVLFLAEPKAAASWWRRREFRGVRRPVLEQYVLSLLLRCVVIGWDDGKAALLIEKWRSLHSITTDIQGLIPGLLVLAHKFGDKFVTEWKAKN